MSINSSIIREASDSLSVADLQIEFENEDETQRVLCVDSSGNIDKYYLIKEVFWERDDDVVVFQIEPAG